MAKNSVVVGESIALAAIVSLAVVCVLPGLKLPVSFDARVFYFPMARRLLDEGLAYFHRPDSLAYSPGAYVYPALLGANEIVVRWANVALYAGTIALGYFAVRGAHSPRAALVAALLLAVSPTLRPLIADALTEPTFIFMVALWAASIAAVVRGHRKSGTLAGGIALGLAALTRPAVMYFPFLAAAVFAWRAWRGRGEDRQADAWLALLHVVALAVYGAYVVRNAIEFGFPSIAAGAGAAFFFGMNPLVDGFDPGYYGLSFDDGAVTMGLGPLSLEGDRLLRRVALRELADVPLPVLAEMAVRKAFAFVFVTANGADNIVLLRLWRVALVVFAFAAVMFERRSRLTLALAGLTAYMVAVHVPLLYVHRYSVGGIDFPLTLLAGIGLAAWLQTPRRAALMAFTAVIAGGVAVALIGDPGPGSPRIERSTYQTLWTREQPAGLHLARNGAIEIPITHVPGFDPRNHFMLTMELALAPEARGVACRAMRVRYKGLAEAQFAPERVVRIPLQADGRMRELRIGMANPVFMDREGTLRLEFECDTASEVKIGRMRVLMPNRAVVYRDLVRAGR